MTTAMELTKGDIEALQRALKAVRAESAEHAVRLDSLAEQKGWFKAASDAVYRCQLKSLQLKPWFCPPMDCGDTAYKNGGYGNTAKEVRLRLKMKALGISVYEPFPAEAIAKAKEARRGAHRAAGRKKGAPTASMGAPTTPAKPAKPTPVS
jgi:hypothetical protein